VILIQGLNLLMLFAAIVVFSRLALDSFRRRRRR